MASKKNYFRFLVEQALIVTGSEDQAGLALMTSIAARRLRQAWPVSGVALRLEGQSWVPFLPPIDHPHHLPFKLLWLDSIGRDYARQQEVLNAIHREKEEDIFVASYCRAEEPNTGHQWSWCVWTEGMDTLLPCTDQVAFVRVKEKDGEVAAIGPWARVREVVGDLMEPLGVYPERYRVRAFPTAEQLAAVGLLLPGQC